MNEPIFSVLSDKASLLSFSNTTTGLDSINRPLATNSSSNSINLNSFGSTFSSRVSVVALSLSGSGTLSGDLTTTDLWSPTNLGGGILEKDGSYRYATSQTLNAGVYYFRLNSFGGSSNSPSIRNITWSGSSISCITYFPLFNNYTQNTINSQATDARRLTSNSSGIEYTLSNNRIDYRIFLNTGTGFLNFTIASTCSVTLYAGPGVQHYFGSSSDSERWPLQSSSLNGNTANQWTLNKIGNYAYNILKVTGNYTHTVTLNPGTYFIRLQIDGNYASPPTSAYVEAQPL